MAKHYQMVHSDCWTPLDAEGTCPRCGGVPDMQSIEGFIPKPLMGFNSNPAAKWCSVHGGWYTDQLPCSICKARQEAIG